MSTRKIWRGYTQKCDIPVLIETTHFKYVHIFLHIQTLTFLNKRHFPCRAHCLLESTSSFSNKSPQNYSCVQGGAFSLIPINRFIFVRLSNVPDDAYFLNGTKTLSLTAGTRTDYVRNKDSSNMK
jgi:hypothetical protein